MKPHSLAKRWRTRINWADRTQLANPLNQGKMVRAVSGSARKEKVPAEELSAIKSRMRQTSRHLFTEAFSEVWEKPFTPQEQEQFQHHLTRSVEKLVQPNPRFKTIAERMIALMTEPKTISSQSVLSEAIDLSKSKGKWANATTNFMAQIHLRPALVSAMVETAVGMYFLRIFHAQGINATPSQVMHALREKFGSIGNEKYIEANKFFERPPSPEDVREIYSRVRHQRKSAKKEVWSRHLAEADQRKETFENNRPAIRTALKDVFLPPNARRKLIEKAVKRLLNEDSRALSDLHTQAIQLSAQFLRKKMEALGYKPSDARELLERIGINGTVIDEQALHELHFEFDTSPTEKRRVVFNAALERLSKIPHPEREMERLVKTLDQTKQVTLQQMMKLDQLLRSAIIRNIPPNVLESAAQHLLLWRIITHGSEWPLESQIAVESRLDRTGIDILPMLIKMKQNGLLGRHSQRWFVDDLTLKQKYSNAKPGRR